MAKKLRVYELECELRVTVRVEAANMEDAVASLDPRAVVDAAADKYQTEIPQESITTVWEIL